MAFATFLDTCTLFGAALTDLLLTLAERGLFRPLWLADVLAELESSLVRRGLDADKVQYRVESMRRAFPAAAMMNYEGLVPQMTCDSGDRHVLAAAAHGGAAVLVTFNIRLFPESSSSPWSIEVRHLDDFLLDQLDLYEDATMGALLSIVSVYEHPPLTSGEYLDKIRRAGVPRFADQASRLL